VNTNPITFPQPKRVDKAWGYELWLHNDNGYCGKILHFDSGKRFSMHFHAQKHETWYVARGSFLMDWICPLTAERKSTTLLPGHVVVIPPGNCHRLYAGESSEIFEVSTTHYEHDSYRVEPGDSQK